MYRFLLNKDGMPILSAFLKAIEGHRRLLVQRTQRSAFSPNELEIIIYLKRHGGSCTSKQLADFFGTSKSLISHSVDKLLAGGYLSAVEDEADKRRITLSLNQKSCELAEQVNAQTEEFFTMLTHNISEEDWAAFMRVLVLMTGNLEAETGRLKELYRQ